MEPPNLGVTPFLQGEEHYDKIGLDDGKEIFINDVLETAEWFTLP